MSTDLALPSTEHLACEMGASGVLRVTFNRPKVRNAMSLQTVTELETVFEAIAGRRDVRVVVLRGAGGHFCAGGDIKDMASARGAPREDGKPDPLAIVNRRFGAMITMIDQAPQIVVAVLEGAVLGGGFGLACVADIAIAHAAAKFGLPETTLGVPPAQIAPFLVRRLGPSRARQLALTARRFGGVEAMTYGLVHELAEDDEALEAKLAEVLSATARCAPQAVALTKDLMARVGTEPLTSLLDAAADGFAVAARGPEGIEGMTAFIQKRKPQWSEGGA